jgi:hypothetical protein
MRPEAHAMKWLDRLMGREPDKNAKARAPAKTSATASGTKRLTGYQAVSIIPCLDACPAAQMAKDTRFLVAKAPRLPLPDCATPRSCSCRFRKYEDRRRDEQRSPYQNVGGFTYAGAERRRRKGRRSSDR